MHPVCRGKAKINEDGHVVFAGKWAMTVDQFKAGKTNKFMWKSEAKNVGVPAENKAVELANTSALRFWGYFVLEEVEGEREKVRESNIVISFDRGEDGSYTVKGKGENKFGKFEINGMYDPAKRKLVVKKLYEPDDSDGASSDEEGDYVMKAGADEDDEETLDAQGEQERLGMADELAALKADQEMSIEELRKTLQRQEEIERGQNLHGVNTATNRGDGDDEDYVHEDEGDDEESLDAQGEVDKAEMREEIDALKHDPDAGLSVEELRKKYAMPSGDEKKGNESRGVDKTVLTSDAGNVSSVVTKKKKKYKTVTRIVKKVIRVKKKKKKRERPNGAEDVGKATDSLDVSATKKAKIADTADRE